MGDFPRGYLATLESSYQESSLTYWSRSRTTSGGDSIGAGNQGTRCTGWVLEALSGSSSPTATTSPPEDNGCLGPDAAEPEAEEGRGFRRTGEEVLIFEFWAWKEEKEGTSMVVSFVRAGMGVAAAVEAEDAPLRCGDRPGSMAKRELEESSADCHVVRLLCKLASGAFGDENENRERIGEG